MSAMYIRDAETVAAIKAMVGEPWNPVPMTPMHGPFPVCAICGDLMDVVFVKDGLCRACDDAYWTGRCADLDRRIADEEAWFNAYGEG